ncbi:hypothetical protein, partial [Geodermatophilus sp. CPCC 205761]|uniref:hypothetical protein n=1 Tax=Geodermatophilus sp. CPCC 205761 TaxID=2936597 RepID=UPI003EE96358
MATLNRASAPRVEDAAPEGDLPTAVARRRRRVPAPRSRVAYALGLATVCTVAAVNLVAGGTATPATASPQEQSASVAVADALGIEETAAGQPAAPAEDPRLLEQLAATRAGRGAGQAAAAAV